MIAFCPQGAPRNPLRYFNDGGRGPTEVHILYAFYTYRIFRCISRDFKTEKFAPKIDLDLYTDDNFKVSKIGADFLICCSNLQIIYP